MEPLLVDFIKRGGTGNAATQSREVQQIADAMKAQKCSLSDLLEMLEPSLTSTDDKERNRSTVLIACLLEIQGIVDPSPSVMHLFVVFFCRRLQDHPSIAPCLQALTTIITHFASSLEPRYCNVMDMIQTLGKRIKLSNYPQTVRQRAFDLLHSLIASPTLVDQVNAIGSLFLEATALSIDGEKDPRCLLLALKVIYQSIVALPNHLLDTVPDLPGHPTLAALLFDNVSCYFPISFHPPENDPIGISTQMLEQALENCLCTNEHIIDLALPFFLGQLRHNEGADARVAALQSLVRIVQTKGIDY